MTNTESGATLLALSPDDVFSSRGISEVIELHKKIQSEIEKKREDLRAMVGERYRELIHAADTIGDMKLTTQRSLEHLGATVALCRNLHDTHLIGFKIPEKTKYTDRTDGRVAAHAIAVQVKILLETPERVWRAIESDDLLQATQLFIFARHIYTGLQLQASNKKVEAVTTSLKPLLQRQWTSLSNLHHVLETASRQKLEQAQLSQQVACSCLLSLHLLSPNTSLLHLLSTLIELHGDRGLARQLHCDPGARDNAQVCRSIVDSATLVVKTIELVQKCFVESGPGSVTSGLTAMYSADSAPLLALLNFQDSHLLGLLPPVVASYRLTAPKEIKPLSKEEISDTVSKWIANVKVYIEEKVTLLLSNINNAKTLNQIREEATKIETPESWSHMCFSLGVPDLDVWRSYFQPLVTERVKRTIELKWGSILDAFRTQMSRDLARLSGEDCAENEADINWFVWKDLIGETVIESREKVVEVMTRLMKEMAHQDCGFTPTLERMCHNIDKQLTKLLTDLSTYMRKEEVDTLLTDLTEDTSDREEIQVYLSDITARNIASMLDYIREECFNNPNLQKTDLQKQTTAIYTARFIQSLTVLMPSLRKCFVPSEDGVDPYNLKENDGLTRWNDVCGRLKESCLYCWGKWIDIAVVKIEGLKRELPQEFSLVANIDFLLLQWDVIKIEEKDDQGNQIESTIKIPHGPSLKLQQFIYSSSRILDQVVPHTLPKEVHSNFIERLSSITLSHYDKVIRENETNINQKCAFQLLMDVRHATLLLVQRDNKACIDLSHDICERLRKIIDPFDYDVFYPYLQTNVKRSVQRVQTLLGCVSGGAEVTGAPPPPTDAPPLLLAAAPSPREWFPLLPVTAPRALRQDKRKKQTVQASSSATVSSAGSKSTASEISELMSTSLSGAKQGAAAFFTDWFSS